MTDIIDILSRTDLKQLAEQAGTQLKETRGEWRGCCPLHHGDNKTAFVVWNAGNKWRWKCYTNNCGEGDALDFVMTWQGLDLPHAMEYLGGDRVLTAEERAAISAEQRQRAEQHAEKKRVEYQAALELLWKSNSWDRYYQNLANFPTARGYWREKGIPDDWQDYWGLGYQPEFFYKHCDDLHQSPSLTIPIFDGGEKPVNVRHRILKPVDPGDKYRPELRGLRAMPFMAAPDLAHNTEIALVLEGEIKAMVSYIYLNDEKIQVYGIPGKKSFGDMAACLKGRRVFVLFDPDAGEQAQAAARAVGGFVMRLPVKIDDALLAGDLDGAGIKRMMRGAARA
jgi:hypothetical protein